MLTTAASPYFHRREAQRKASTCAGMIAASLACLVHGGAFAEVGKRDIWSPARVAQVLELRDVHGCCMLQDTGAHKALSLAALGRLSGGQGLHGAPRSIGRSMHLASVTIVRRNGRTCGTAWSRSTSCQPPSSVRPCCAYAPSSPAVRCCVLPANLAYIASLYSVCRTLKRGTQNIPT